MASLVVLARWEAVILVGGLAAVVLYKLLTGGILLAGLLSGRRSDGTTFFSPGRAQLLMITVLTALQYLVSVLGNPSRDSLPAVPAALVAALGGSQAVFLGGKAWSLFWSGRKNLNG